MPPAPRHSPSPPQTARHATDIDERLLGLLPWLASRFDLSAGSFRGEGPERDSPPGLLAAQARDGLRALGIYERLPHVVRAKLGQWPELEAARLARPAEDSPLARALRPALGRSPAEFLARLAPHASCDFGYALLPDASSPGLMAAAHHLLVVARPGWFAARARPLPVLPASAVESLTERLLATHAP